VLQPYTYQHRHSVLRRATLNKSTGDCARSDLRRGAAPRRAFVFAAKCVKCVRRERTSVACKQAQNNVATLAEANIADLIVDEFQFGRQAKSMHR
jgi:hypothetical protein